MLRRNRPPTTPVEESFQRLVEQHAARLYRVAFAVVRDPHLAEDVVQDTIITAWRHLGDYRGEGRIEGWLSSIAHRTAVAYLRRIRDTATDPGDFGDRMSPTNVESTTIAAEKVSAMFVAIDELDEISRRILLLREFDGRSYAEIAEITGLPLPTVKTRLLRARRAIQDRLAPEGAP